MTEDMIALRGLMEKSADADLLRGMTSGIESKICCRGARGTWA